MQARLWRARVTPAQPAAGAPPARAATGRAAATRTTLGRAPAKRSGLAGGAERPRLLRTGRTVAANRVPRRGEPVQRRSARRDRRGEAAEPGWPPSWARRP